MGQSLITFERTDLPLTLDQKDSHASKAPKDDESSRMLAKHPTWVSTPTKASSFSCTDSYHTRWRTLSSLLTKPTPVVLLGLGLGGQREGNASSHLTAFQVGNKTLKKNPTPQQKLHTYCGIACFPPLKPIKLHPNIGGSGSIFFPCKFLRLLWKLFDSSHLVEFLILPYFPTRTITEQSLI